MKSRFNIRVYGLWISGAKVLLSSQYVKGAEIIKFPGGGLEYGEGTIEALKREFIEEMGVEIEDVEHYYTTDFFQPSAWDDSQVVSIYYTVRPRGEVQLPFENGAERFFFAEIDDQLERTISLPIDKVVAGKLIKSQFSLG